MNPPGHPRARIDKLFFDVEWLPQKLDIVLQAPLKDHKGLSK
jgi:hypothetical protein